MNVEVDDVDYYEVRDETGKLIGTYTERHVAEMEVRFAAAQGAQWIIVIRKVA